MGAKEDIKSFFKKFWFLVWKDDSLKGWLLSIVFLFVFIKFIFFPVISFVMGTSLPLAIVESCSMYHEGNLFSNFAEWYDRHEVKYAGFFINKSVFGEFPLKNGFNKGDILLIIGADPDKVKVGDVIIFNANQRNPIIHRVISIEETNEGRVFSTVGDNNNGQISFEKQISEDMLVGKAVFRLAPYFGWVKLAFYDWQKPVAERGLCREN